MFFVREKFDAKKIGDCFFSADKSKMLNCVSASSLAQPIELRLNGINNYPDKESGLYCQH